MNAETSLPQRSFGAVFFPIVFFTDFLPVTFKKRSAKLVAAWGKITCLLLIHLKDFFFHQMMYRRLNRFHHLNYCFQKICLRKWCFQMHIKLLAICNWERSLLFVTFFISLLITPRFWELLIHSMIVSTEVCFVLYRGRKTVLVGPEEGAIDQNPNMLFLVFSSSFLSATMLWVKSHEFTCKSEQRRRMLLRSCRVHPCQLLIPKSPAVLIITRKRKLRKRENAFQLWGK